MDNKNSQKFPKNFTCNFCNYNTTHKNDFNKHLQSKKHNDNIMITKIPNICICGQTYKYSTGLSRHKLKCFAGKNEMINDNWLKMAKNGKKRTINNYTKNYDFTCDCGKFYKHQSSLSKHKKKCKTQLVNNNKELDLKNMFIDLMKKNTEILEEVKEIAKEPKIINNTTNNTTNNTQFNIMNYLNNECKDAMNLSDFINELPFSLDDLEIMGTKGYQQSMEDTFIKQLQIMDKTKRPIHCSDKKRKSFYIKENDIWEKDDDNSKIVNGFKKISQKHLGILTSWTNYNINWSYNERKQNFFNRSVQEVAKYNDSKQINKIICKLTGLTIK
jgi:hypothetical protein